MVNPSLNYSVTLKTGASSSVALLYASSIMSQDVNAKASRPEQRVVMSLFRFRPGRCLRDGRRPARSHIGQRFLLSISKYKKKSAFRSIFSFFCDTHPEFSQQAGLPAAERQPHPVARTGRRPTEAVCPASAVLAPARSSTEKGPESSEKSGREGSVFEK